MVCPAGFVKRGIFFNFRFMYTSVNIITFRPELQPHFEQINKDWIRQYFSFEPIDHAQLENPQENIIDKGGVILFAQSGEEILGTVGLVPAGTGVYEMVKMGVVPQARGYRIGELLVRHILIHAKALGGSKVILYTNSRLNAALHIYRKQGFRELLPECGKYSRCDIKMELDL
jgi:ribosomal protein S18 acetylase RimI-like enzyme